MYKHVQESLIEFSDLNEIKKIVSKSKDMNEDSPDGKEKRANPGPEKNPTAISDVKSILSILGKNWKAFQVASRDNMLAYKSFWDASQELKSKLSSAGDVYRLFGSLSKEKDGKISYNPGNFSVAEVVGQNGDELVVINHDKNAFDGKTDILRIPGTEATKQFNEFISAVKAASQKAKDHYIATTEKKKKEEIFQAMQKGIAKKAAAGMSGKPGADVKESGEGEKKEEKKGGKKGNPAFKKGVKPDFTKKKPVTESKTEQVNESSFEFWDAVATALLQMGYNEEEADFIMAEYDGEVGSPEEVAEVLIKKAMGELKESSNSVNEGREDFMMNYGTEIRDSIRLLNRIRMLINAGEISEEDVIKVLEKIERIYDREVLEYIDSIVLGDPNYSIRPNDIVNLGEHIENRYGTEARQVLNAIDEFAYLGYDPNDDDEE